MNARGSCPLAREQRKLAAILAADVVGYSRLMRCNESGTMARLRKKRAKHLNLVLPNSLGVVSSGPGSH